MRRGLAARKPVAGSFLERPNAFAKRGGCVIHGLRLFDLGNQRGANDSGVGEATEDRNMAGQRNAESNRDWKLRNAASPPQERG
jgi:hypothetical protein